MVTHKDLDIWKLGIELVEQVYKHTAQFPQAEVYGLTSQMRRAAVSVPIEHLRRCCKRRQERIHSVSVCCFGFPRRA